MQRSTHTPSIFAQTNNDSAQRKLDKIMQKYLHLVENDPSRTRQLIPSSEVWRFFVDGIAQEHGKKMAAQLHTYFNDMNMTLKQAAITVENAEQEASKNDEPEEENLEPRNWKEGFLVQYLTTRGWLFTEEEYNQFTLADIITMDKAWLQYENEQGYTAGLYTAYPAIFNFNDDLTNEFIKSLHRSATTNVRHTTYDATSTQDIPGEYRQQDTSTYFQLLPEHCSIQGILNILNKSDVDASTSIYMKVNDPSTMETLAFICINQESLAKIRENLPKVKIDPEYIVALEPHITLDSEAKLNDYQFISELIHTLNFFSEKTNNTDLAKNIYEIISSDTSETLPIFFGSVQPDDTLEILNTKMKQLIQEYQSNIDATKNQLDKLHLIIKFIQDAHQLHPFADGNGRTLCILLFNHLLMRNGFPPTVSPNISQFNACSIEELTTNTLQGMKETLLLIQGKPIHNIDTKEILVILESKPHLKIYADMFQAAVKLEETAKQNQASLKKNL